MVKRAEQLRANKIIADGLRPVTQRVFAIDTIVVLLPHKLAHNDLNELQRLNREDMKRDRGRVLVTDTIAFKKASEWSPPVNYVQRTVIHQPTNEALTLLTETCSGWMVSRLDFAIDLLVPDQASAEQVQKHIVKHLSQPWHGARKASTYKDSENDEEVAERDEDNYTQVEKDDTPGTYYLAPKRSARNVAVYCDRPSKVTGGYTVHIETRSCNARTCRAYGLSHPTDFLALDPYFVFTHHMNLVVFDQGRYERALTKFFQAKQARKPLLHRPRFRWTVAQTVRRHIGMMERILGYEGGIVEGSEHVKLENMRCQRLLEFVKGRERSPLKEVMDDAMVEVPLDALIGGATLHLHGAGMYDDKTQDGQFHDLYRQHKQTI